MTEPEALAPELHLLLEGAVVMADLVSVAGPQAMPATPQGRCSAPQAVPHRSESQVQEAFMTTNPSRGISTEVKLKRSSWKPPL